MNELNASIRDRLFRQENLLLFAIATLLLGFGLRLIHLADVSFTASESVLGALAFQVSKGARVGSGSVPAYLGLTSLIFFLAKDTAFWARIVPVLAGSSLIILPYIWRHRLQPASVVVLTLAFTLDPLLVIFSRQIVSPIIALAAVLWLATAVEKKQPIISGISLAFGLLSGYWVWPVFLALALAALLFTLLKHEPLRLLSYLEWGNEGWLRFWISLALGILMISTSCLRNPAGISGLGQGLADLFNLSAGIFKLPFGLPIYTWLAYSIVPVLFLILVSSQKNKVSPSPTRPFMDAFLVFLFLFCLYFSRQDVGLIVFLTAYFWWVVSSGLGRMMPSSEVRGFEYVALTLFFITLAVYTGITLRSIIANPYGTGASLQAWLAVLAGIVILVLAFVLVRVGWSRELANRSALASLFVVLGVILLATTFNSLYAKADKAALLTQGEALVLPRDVLPSILAELQQEGKLKVENDKALVIDSALPGSAWFLRDFDQQPLLGSSSISGDPEIILTSSDAQPSFANTYRGLSIPGTLSMDWAGMAWGNYLRSLFGAPLLTQDNEIILWVRSDLFPGAYQ